MVQTAIASGSETVVTDPFLSNYAGNMMVVVRDISGMATETTTFDIKIETAKPPANDTCAAPESITIPSVDGQVLVDNTTAIANDDYTGSCAGNGPDLVYTFTVEQAGDFLFETVAGEGNFNDTTLYLRTICDDDTSQVACDDDSGEGLLSKIQTPLEPGQYYLFMDGSLAASAGSFTLSITVTYPQ
jgi:hypothetical protein